RMRRRRARAGVAVAGAAQAVDHRDLARRKVRDGGRDEIRAELAGAALEEGARRVLDLLEPAEPDADEAARSVALFLGELETCILDGELGRGDGELREARHLLDLLPLDELRRFEALDLACDTRREGRGVELGDGADAGLARQHRPPRSLGADAVRR